MIEDAKHTLRVELTPLVRHIPVELRARLLSSLCCPYCGGALSWTINRPVRQISREEKQMYAGMLGLTLSPTEGNSFIYEQETTSVSCAKCSFEVRNGFLTQGV